MIQDQINLSNNIQPLRLRCYICNETGHLMNNCNKLHFIPDSEKIIKVNDFSYPQERNCSYKRVKTKKSKTLHKLHQPQAQVSSIKLKSIEIEDESSNEEESLDDEREESQKISDPKIELNAISESCERKSIFFEKKEERFNKPNIPLQGPGQFSDFMNNSISKPIQLLQSSSDKAGSLENSPNNKKSIGEKKLICEKKNSTIEASTLSNNDILNFERMQNFKTYFPENNFKEIITLQNEKNIGSRINSRINRRKQTEISRLSQYTIRSILLYEAVKNKNIEYKRKKTKNLVDLRKAKEKKEVTLVIPSNERNETLSPLQPKMDSEENNLEKALNLSKRKKKFSLLDLVQAVIKMQKAKKGRLKWVMALRRTLRDSVQKAKKFFHEILKK